MSKESDSLLIENNIVDLSDEERSFYHQVNWLFLKTLELDFYKFKTAIEKEIRFNRFPHVLDVGTGYGAMMYRLKEILKIDYEEMIGIDIDRKLVEYGQPYFESKGYNNIRMHVSSVYDLRNERGKKYAKNYFNLITGLALLEHVDPERALQEIYRVTADNGIVYFPHNVGDKLLPSRSEIYLNRFNQDLLSYQQGSYHDLLEPFIMQEFINQNLSDSMFIEEFFKKSLEAFTILYPWHPLDDIILRNFEHYLIGHQHYKGQRYGNAFTGGLLDTFLKNSGFEILFYERTDWMLESIRNPTQREMMKFLIKVFASANNHQDLLAEEPDKKLDDAKLYDWYELRNQQIENGVLGFQVVQRSIVGKKAR